MPLITKTLDFLAWYTMHLFFRDINVINEHHVPLEGPTIIYGNHNNQFVDGIVTLIKISYSLLLLKGLFIS